METQIMPKMQNSRVVVCSGIDINSMIEKANKLANDLHEMFKDEKNRIIKSSFEFENALLTGNNITGPVNDLKPPVKFVFTISTPCDNDISDNAVFMIEADIIIGKICSYKFDLFY